MNTKKALLLENTTDPEVFQDMDKFEMSEAEKFALSIRIHFPKFSKGFSAPDFESFIDNHIGQENMVSIGRLSFPNQWQIQVKSKKIREDLIRLGRTKINSRSCWISPLSQSEIRGYVHWIPNAVDNKVIEDVLQPFGEILFVETQKTLKWSKVDSDSRYFAMNLKPGKNMDDVPHFIKIAGQHGLITIKGRSPSCFHCRTVGHRKSECKQYRDKLSAYCLRKPQSAAKRSKPRGRRYTPLEPEEKKGKKKKAIKKEENPSGAKGPSDSFAAKASCKIEAKSGAKSTAMQTDLNLATSKESKVKTVVSKEQLSKELEIFEELKALKGISGILSSTANKWETTLETVRQKLESSVIDNNPTEETPNNSEAVTEGKKKRKKKKKKSKSTAGASSK